MQTLSSSSPESVTQSEAKETDGERREDDEESEHESKSDICFLLSVGDPSERKTHFLHTSLRRAIRMEERGLLVTRSTNMPAVIRTERQERAKKNRIIKKSRSINLQAGRIKGLDEGNSTERERQTPTRTTSSLINLSYAIAGLSVRLHPLSSSLSLDHNRLPLSLFLLILLCKSNALTFARFPCGSHRSSRDGNGANATTQVRTIKCIQRKTRA